MILLFLFIIETTVGVNILQFKHKRADGGATIQNNPIGKVPSSLTFCLDFDLKLIRLLYTLGTADLDILIPETLDSLRVFGT